MNYEIFLIGGSYNNERDGPVVELFGRMVDGTSVTARYYGFLPYFYLKEPGAETLERLEKDKAVKGKTEKTLWVDGAPRKCVRVDVTEPNSVPSYRREYGTEGDETSVLACDIPFAHRFLYDILEAGTATISFEGEPEPAQIASGYGTNKVVRIVGKIRAAKPFRPKLTYLSFDIENSLKDRRIFCLSGTVQRGDDELVNFSLDGAEKGIIQGFLSRIREFDPDIITGYNIGGYDLPLLLERAEVNGMSKSSLGFGRDFSPLSDIGDRLWRTHGRVIADAWWSARTILRPKQESLHYVSTVLLGEGKLDVDRRNMDEEWAKDAKKVVRYCEKDSQLALRILRKLHAIEKAMDMASVAGLYLDEGLNGRTSTLVDALLIRGADRSGIGVPPSHHLQREAPIEGGYVLELKPQLAHWVIVLDFKSMYPSIMISKNICFTTISDQGTIEAPNGIRFLSRDARPGLIPEMLKSLMGERDRLKRLFHEAPSAEERDYFDGLQAAVKVLMNSFYGVMASSFYRFTNKEIGAAITAFARNEIRRVIDEVEGSSNQVIYSDTDSVFVKSPQENPEGARDFGEDLSKRFTHEGSTLEFQSVFQSFFSHGAKKRYVARQVWPKVELVVRGYETRRGDSFELQVSALNEMFELILDGRTDDAVQRAREMVKTTAEGKVEMEKLVIARTVRQETEYNEKTRDSLPYLRVFRKLKAEGYDVVPGMKVAWIVVNSKKSPQDVEPYLAGRPYPEGRAPDYNYYAGRMAQTLSRITEVFGCDEDDLLDKGHKQHRLGTEADRPGVTAGLDTPVGALKTETKKGKQTTFE